VPPEDEAKALEDKATQSCFTAHDNEAAATQWEKAGAQRDQLGSDAKRSAEYWENPAAPEQPKPDLVRSRRCEAARQYALAADDYLAAAWMFDRLAEKDPNLLHRAVWLAKATAARQKAKEAAQNAVAWLETCLDRKFEEGEITKELADLYRRLAIYLDNLDREEGAMRALHKAEQVDELRKKAAEEAKKALKGNSK
jgi:predicted O-linked N-acetylglucosamine transferase (SPINDLY family)